MRRYFMLAALLGLASWLALSGAAGREHPLVRAVTAAPEGNTTFLLPAFMSEVTGHGSPFDSGYNCRYGTAAWGPERVGRLALLGGGWYVSFSHVGFDRPAEIEYVPMVRMKQDRDGNGNRLPSVTMTPALTQAGLGKLINDLPPGTLWLIGNEPDRIFVQDDTMPDVYAHAYHDAYEFIKARDPSARVGVAGLVQVTPGRLQYLDIVWNTYFQSYGRPMPVDVWNMHVYILPEVKADGSNSRAALALGTDPALAILENETGSPQLCPQDDVYCYAEHDSMAIFAEQIRAMREWMKARGEQQKPLIITEYSTLYPYTIDDPQDPSQCFLKDENGHCFTPGRVSQYMLDTFDYLEYARDLSLGYAVDDHRLVQQWLWFALHDYHDSSNKLLEADLRTFTKMGETFTGHLAGIPRQANLRPQAVWGGVGYTHGFTASVPLTMRLRNTGNLDVRGRPFTIAFYADPGFAQPVAEAVVDSALGCAREEITVTVSFTGLTTPGLHTFWYKIDSDGVIPESNEFDNSGSAQFFVDPDQLFLPTISRGGLLTIP